VELQAIEAVAGRPEPSDGTRLGRARIARLGARTAGDAVREVPGGLLREDGVGGAQTISIRGSGTDAVLVLVDGVPINDPVTGVADLSTIPAAIIESVTVRVGAHSARYGPRAEAGVVEIETRMAESGVEMRAAGGTLGEWAVGGEIGGRGRGIGWSGGGHVRGMDGGFD